MRTEPERTVLRSVLPEKLKGAYMCEQAKLIIDKQAASDFGYYVESILTDHISQPFIHTGAEVPKVFTEMLRKEAIEIDKKM